MLNDTKLRKPNTLSEKQFKFCHAYLSNGWNATKASISAGDTKKNASRNAYLYLKRKPVVEYLKSQKRIMERIMTDNFTWKLSKLKKIIDLCVPEESVVGDQINPSPAISAIAEMNRMEGDYFSERQQDKKTTDEEMEKVKEYSEELTRLYEEQKKDY